MITPRAQAFVIVLALALRVTIGLAAADDRWRVFPLAQVYAPAEIAVGPDGAIWGPAPNVQPGLFRAARDGTVTYIRTAKQPTVIASGSDGRLWATIDLGHILAYDPKTKTQTVYLAVPKSQLLQPYNMLVLGGDGNIWYSVSSQLVAMTPEGRLRVAYRADPNGDVGSALSAARDGRIWFTFAHRYDGPNYIAAIDSHTHVTRWVLLPRAVRHASFSIAATDDGGAYLSASTDRGSYFLKYDRELHLVFVNGPLATFVGAMAVAADGNVYFSTGSGNALGIFHPDSKTLTLEYTPNQEVSGALLIDSSGSVWTALGPAPGYGQAPSLGQYAPR